MQKQSFEIGKDYSVPSWSAMPKYKYFFEVIKNGATIEEKQVNKKEFYLIGKFSDISDIVLEHMTISRKHAILQHKNNGEIYLYDLGSTHGTFVNKKKLPSKVFHKLNVFDNIRFGMSSRLYILRCQELEEEEDQKEQEQLDKSQGIVKEEKEPEKQEKSLKDKYLDLLNNDPYYLQSQKAKKSYQGSQNEKYDGVSWGQVDEMEVYQFQENDLALEPALLKRLPDLTDKQVHKIEQYEQKLHKYRNVEEQLQELANKDKQQNGLEQHLQEKKQQLQQKVMEYGSQVEQAEQAIRCSLFGEEIESNFNQEKQQNIDEDTYGDDDFYDRTIGQKRELPSDLYQSKIQKKQQNSETTTDDYWNLKKRLESLIKVRHHYNMKLLEMKNDEEKMQNEEEEDELEKFMNQTGQELNQENKELIKKKLIEHNKEIEQITALLQNIKPNINVEKDASQNIAEVFGDEDEDPKVCQKKYLKQKQKELEKQKQQKQENKIQSDFQAPKSKISSTLQKLKEIKKTHEMDFSKDEGEDEEEQEQTDEQLLQLAAKQIQREKQYLKKIKVDEDDELDQKRQDFLQSQHFISQNEQIKKEQNVFDINAQALKKSQKKLKQEQEEKQKEIEKQQLYDSIITPFDD